MNEIERAYLKFSIDQTIESLDEVKERLANEDYNETYDVTGMVAVLNSFRWELDAFIEDFTWDDKDDGNGRESGF